MENIKYFKLQSAILLLILLALACDDHGIEPKPIVAEPPGFSGTITFIGEWPDSIKRTHIIVFKDPLLSAADFNIFNLRFVSREIPFGTTIYEYSSRDSSVIPGTGVFEPGRYAYVAVAQQTTENLSLLRRDWFVAGVYYASGDTAQPGTLVIPDSAFVTNINIICDYNNPPQQPPGGITPSDKISGFSGRVNFINEWPDSIKRAFVVVFQNPLLTPDDFNIFNLKFLSREIPLESPVYEYSSLDSAFIPEVPGPFPPGSYAYVAVAQQSTPEISLARKDWFVSGIYYTSGDTTQPGKMVIPDSAFVEDINITVDFNNPPPQPPG